MLPRLYASLVIPRAVLKELVHPDAPVPVRNWATDPPDWLEIRQDLIADPGLSHLGAGEASALTLAKRESDVFVLVDDAAARLSASQLRIPTMGTVGVLKLAAIDGHVNLALAVKRLKATNFRVSQSLIDNVLEDAERRRRV